MEVKVDQLSVFVLGIEDIMVARLNAFVHWKSTDDGNWARELIAIHEVDIDWPYLRTSAAGNRVDKALGQLVKELGLGGRVQ